MSDAVSTREARHEPASELELAERARGGDASAFRAIMQRNNARLFRVARSVLKEDADAEDAVQETYLKAYTKLGEFRGESTLSTWLTRIVLNESLMRLRQVRRTAEAAQTFEQNSRSGQVVRFPGMGQGRTPRGLRQRPRSPASSNARWMPCRSTSASSSSCGAYRR